MSTKQTGHKRPPEFQLLWGDLHRQTGLTCGEGTVEDHFAAARDRFGLDFFSVTDNAVLTEDPRRRQFAGPKLMAHRHFLRAMEAHSITQEDYNDLRQFAASVNGQKPYYFIGYEWCSNRWGDRNVYHYEDGDMVLEPELVDLHKAFANTDTLMVIHHPGYGKGRRGADWNHLNGRLERLVEIFSTQHGSSEGPVADPAHPLYSNSMGGLVQENSVMAALARGHKLGLTAGSDAHTLDQVPGKTGVFTTDGSRRGLWEALKHRRTIATTGPKFPFWFEADGHGIGSIVTTDTLPTLKVFLPPHGWLKAEILRNGKVIHTWTNDAPEGEGVNGYDLGGAVAYSYEETHTPDLQPDNFYLLRVHLADNHRAWSSPIWISYLPDVPFAHDTLYWLPEERCSLWVIVKDDVITVTFENGQVAGSTLGSLMAPDDVTVPDATIAFIDADGGVIEERALGTVAEGASEVVTRPFTGDIERVRVTYIDPFENIRIIERRMFVPPAGSRLLQDIVKCD